jgi:hypothetical protein
MKGTEFMPKDNNVYDTSKVVSKEAQDVIEKVEGGKAAQEMLKDREKKITQAKEYVTELPEFTGSGAYKVFEMKTQGNLDPKLVFDQANLAIDWLEAANKAYNFLQTEQEEVFVGKIKVTPEIFNKWMTLSLEALSTNIANKEKNKNFTGQDLPKQRIKNLMPNEKTAA